MIIIQETHSNNRFSNMKLSMYWQGGNKFPRLKGKARECKNIGMPLLNIFEAHYDRRSWEQRKIRLAIKMSILIESILDDNKDEYRLSETNAKKFLDAVHSMNCLTTELGNFFHSQRPHIELFNYTIKNHYLIHIALMSKYLNPSLVWCYQGEDFVGRMKILVQQCIKALPAHKVFNKAMQKYVHGLSFLLRVP